MIELEAITKIYATRRGDQIALADITLHIEAGEFVAICGHSGSGKSTMLGILGGLCRPTSGAIRVDGVAIQGLNAQQLADFRGQRVGFVFQFPSLLHNLRAIDNVALPALIRGDLDYAAAYDAARRGLAEVGLAERWDAYPAELSGGQQRRVSIARALINNPPILLADEPTSDLDVEQEQEIFALLLSLQKTRGSSLILVTHNLALCERARRVVHLQKGRIAREVKPTSLVDQHRGPAAKPFTAVRTTGVPEPVALASAEAAPLGSGLGRFLLDFTGWVVAAAIGIGLVNYGAKLWQRRDLATREEARKAVEELALQKLRADIENVITQADGNYRISIYVQNQGTVDPIYVMGPALRAFVQVDGAWQAVPVEAVDCREGEVRRIDDKTVCSFILRADLKKFDELLKGYMHVRITNTMIVAEKAEPGGDLFDRTDDYYFYLLPAKVADDEVRQANRWKAGSIVPRWIPMPAH